VRVGEKVNLGEKAKVDGEKLYIFLNARKLISPKVHCGDSLTDFPQISPFIVN
jgi:hypothetical protein